MDYLINNGLQLWYRLRMDMGRIFIVIGIIFILIGAGWALGLGRLPGDIIIRRGNATFFFPVVTSIILSIILSALLYIFIGRNR